MHCPRRDFCARPRPGRDRASGFDIEHHLGVGAPGVAGGGVLTAVHRDSRDRRHRDAQFAEIGLQVLGSETAAKLDDPDGLPLPGPLWKVIEPGYLRMSEGDADSGLAFCGELEVRLSLRTIVQAEYTSDDRSEFSRDVYRPGPPAIASAGVVVSGKLHAEGGAKGSHRPGQNYAVPRGMRFDYGQIVGAGKGSNRSHILGLTAITCREIFAPQVTLRERQAVSPGVPRSSFPADDDRNQDALGGICRFPRPRSW
jgi:hypothetical protein